MRIELKECYRDYRWRDCRISNQEVCLFENKKQAYDYLDNGYGCDIQPLDDAYVRDWDNKKRECPIKWIKIEEENEHFGVMTLRTDWRLGGIMRDIVAYRRDVTYLDLMTEENKEKLMKILRGDEWFDITFVAVSKSGNKYSTEIRFSISERDEIGLDEWIRENLWIRHSYSHYSQNMAASDFKFKVGEFESAYFIL